MSGIPGFRRQVMRLWRAQTLSGEVPVQVDGWIRLPSLTSPKPSGAIERHWQMKANH